MERQICVREKEQKWVCGDSPVYFWHPVSGTAEISAQCQGAPRSAKLNVTVSAGGGCSAPIGCFAEAAAGLLVLRSQLFEEASLLLLAHSNFSKTMTLIY